MDDSFGRPCPRGCDIVGTDIHGSLSTIKRPMWGIAEQTAFLRWDIGHKLPMSGQFDVVICRASIHHTETLAPRFKPA